MEIGRKIKNARAAAGLTQEQAAEALGVSRQTISNWENGKTWPDIVSVVKMSDLYDISLDCLLKDEKKEEKPVSDYVSYLAESADAAAGRARLEPIRRPRHRMGQRQWMPCRTFRPRRPPAGADEPFGISFSREAASSRDTGEES